MKNITTRRRYALLSPVLIDTMIFMGGANAGIKRNRLPRGQKAVKEELLLSPETSQALRAAARESGRLSPALYLELLRKKLEAEYGTMPILTPPLDEPKELPIAAA